MLPIATDSIWSLSEIPLSMTNNPQNHVSQVNPLAEFYPAHGQALKHGRNTQSSLLLLHRGRVTNKLHRSLMEPHYCLFKWWVSKQKRWPRVGDLTKNARNLYPPYLSLSRSPKNKYLCEESASLFHHLEPLFNGHWQAKLHIRYTPQTPYPDFSSHRQPPPEEGDTHSSGSNRLLPVPSRLLDLRTTTTWQQLVSFGKTWVVTIQVAKR